jgi:glycosyltransferase involved in cell wall biosynthesis
MQRPVNPTQNELPDGSALSGPVVSIIIPAYKTAPYIAETLDSVFAQTFPSFEVIVINDGSPDTPELERVLQPYLNRILYFRQANQGPAAARNLAIRLARGKYLAFLDSDDCWLPEYLAEQVNVLEASPAVVMTCCDTRLFGESPDAGKCFFELHPPKTPVTFDSLITEECSIVTSCAVVRTQAVADAGNFDEHFVGGEDFDLWMRLSFRGGEIAFVNKALGRRRIHPAAMTAANVSIQSCLVSVLKKLDRTLPLSPHTRALLRRRLECDQAYVDLENGKRFLLAGNSGLAGELLLKAYPFYRGRKLQATLVGLRIAPRLTAFLARLWQRWLSRRTDAHLKVGATESAASN